MRIPDSQIRPGWREKLRFFLGNILINVLLITGVIVVCIWFPFGWLFKKCKALLKRLPTDKTKHMLPVALSLLLAASTCPGEVCTWAFPSNLLH